MSSLAIGFGLVASDGYVVVQPFSRVCVSRCWLAGKLACWLVDMFPDAFKRVSGRTALLL